MNDITQTDRYYMHRCLQLARCGFGSTSPNPLVGAVIVCDGRIIGEGYHIRSGEPHAEVNAVASVKECDLNLLSRSTIYVSLEPCSHYGKTPPCADLIIRCRIPRVVVACTDSNSCVNGGGISRLRDAGVEVVVGILNEEAVRLNEKFFTYHLAKRPFVALKWAESADGFIDAMRSDENQSAVAVSTSGSLVATHRLRAEYDAIMVGTRTALLDNPSLSLRYWAGNQPLRVVIDRVGVLPATLNLFDGTAPTLLFTSRCITGKFGKNVEQIELDFSADVLPAILANLHSRKINSLLVEGGACLLQSFMDSSLWDTARVERNPRLFLGNGVASPVLPANALLEREFSCFGNEIKVFTRKNTI